ncbi:hypothetical protein ANO11243_089500 [Dothideomycetidae sp. 11243]|nr:hypothetical protein ANO11243_089500 [fungal sp. No.11243]
MSSTHNQPRRRPAANQTPSVDSISDAMSSVSLRKSSTFQVKSKPDSAFLDPFLRGLSLPQLPPRSSTCAKSLEDLIIGPGERRVSELLKRVDDAYAAHADLSAALNEPDVLPASRCQVQNHGSASAPLTRRSSIQSYQDDRDSGIGSSISSPTLEKLEIMDCADDNSKTPIVADIDSASGSTKSQHRLSEFAQKQVQDLIIKPILEEDSLKDYHPLIRGVPQRIDSKEISTLRDLEKTIIYLAPEYSRTVAALRSFCSAFIWCLNTTVHEVHESDRSLPSDRPYSTTYFLDLVEQIRRYAGILAATRQKLAEGKPLDETDALPTDRIELQGGMSHNGKPAVLTRVKDEKHISLSDDKVVSAEDVAVTSSKRPMTDNTDDDSAVRSMARRKKGEIPQTYRCTLAGCDRTFQRRCDWNKHAKSHERPWKCKQEDCAYHKKGFPTKKECDRHFDDVHGNLPFKYRCEICGAPNKRMYNLKYHMEKSHGVPYIRTKGNNKGKSGLPENESTQSSPSVGMDFQDNVSTATNMIPALTQLEHGTDTTFFPSPTGNNELSPINDSALQWAFFGSTDPSATGAPNAAEWDFGGFGDHFNTNLFDPSPTMPLNSALPSPWTGGRRGSATTLGTSESPLNTNMDEDLFCMLSNPQQDYPASIALIDQQAVQDVHAGSTSDLLNFSPQGQDCMIGGDLDFSLANGEFADPVLFPSGSQSTRSNYTLMDISNTNMNSHYHAGGQSTQDELAALFNFSGSSEYHHMQQ